MNEETLEKLDYFCLQAGKWAEWLVQLFKTAWAQPYSKEMFLAAFALFVVLLVFRRIKKRFRSVRLFDNRAGVVEVSRGALDDLVQSVCYSMGAVNRPEVEIYTHFGRLCMKVSLKLESNQKLMEASSYIQSALSTAFREYLGVEKLGRIDVKVIGFKGLIFKPEHKLLPPSPELDKEEPIFDTVDSSPRKAQANSPAKREKNGGGILP